MKNVDDAKSMPVLTNFEKKGKTKILSRKFNGLIKTGELWISKS